MKISTINFFVALKNASVANKGIINIKANQEIIPILQCLYEQGFVLSFNYIKNQKTIRVVFKKESGLNFFINLKFMSTSSNGSYIKYLDVCKILNQYKLLIVSTHKGLLTGEACKKYKLGGKLLFVS